MPVIGDRIRERRLLLGLSQQQLGGKELTRSFISLVEQGKAQPSRTTLELIARRLEKPPEYFISGEDSGDQELIVLLERATQRHIANSEWDEAIQHAENMLRIAERLGRPDVEVRIRGMLAYSLLYARRYEAAVEAYDLVIDHCKRTNDNDALVDALLHRGMACHNMEDYFNARRNYLEAIRLSEEKKSLLKTKAQALINLGSCCAIMGGLDQAIEAYDKAINTVVPSEYPRVFADACNGLSICMRRMQQWKEALYYARQALKALEPIDPIAALDAKYSLVAIQAESEAPEEALPGLMQCLESYGDLGKTRRQAWVHSLLALCYLRTGAPDQAEASCTTGLDLLDLDDDSLARGILYRRMAQARLDLGDKARAKEYLRMSLSILRRIRAHAEVDVTAQTLVDWM